MGPEAAPAGGGAGPLARGRGRPRGWSWCRGHAQGSTQSGGSWALASRFFSFIETGSYVFVKRGAKVNFFAWDPWKL